ncbi:MAG: DUF5067 domain-containing protein [Ruminococcaceae bacterium]|nr:DUF5067 domain-containing protein [Oscillospiraceae bacterium]
MKKIISLLLAIMLVATFGVFAMASSDSEGGTADQGNGSVGNEEIGDYSVVIESCRLSKDYSGKPVVIVKYIFTNNNSDESTSFSTAFDEEVYQGGVGLNEAFMVDKSANYESDAQYKDIKKGSSIEVEVAYDLNDTTTDIEVEVQELFSFDDRTITKTFSIAK